MIQATSIRVKRAFPESCKCGNNGGGDCDFCLMVLPYRDQHFEEVVCSDCKEWTTFGDSCCGQTQCEEACPYCQEIDGGAA